jgi:hypothetical protein
MRCKWELFKTKKLMLLHFFKRFSRMLSYVLVACHPAYCSYKGVNASGTSPFGRSMAAGAGVLRPRRCRQYRPHPTLRQIASA